MDLAHRDVDRRLAHLRQPDQGGLVVDARPSRCTAEVTEYARRGASLPRALSALLCQQPEPRRRTRIGFHQKSFGVSPLAPRGPAPRRRICRPNESAQPYCHGPAQPSGSHAVQWRELEPVRPRSRSASSRFGRPSRGVPMKSRPPAGQIKVLQSVTRGQRMQRDRHCASAQTPIDGPATGLASVAGRQPPLSPADGSAAGAELHHLRCGIDRGVAA